MITKFRFIVLCILLNTFSLRSYAMAGVDEVIETLKTSMSTRDAKQFADFFDNTIDMTFSNVHSTYTRGHALIILNNFYTKNHPKSFKIDYQGTSPQSDAQYVIGTAITENGSYRVYLYIKNKDNKQVIQEMKIAKQ